MSEAQRFAAHDHGGLRHEHFCREGDGHDHRPEPPARYDFDAPHHQPTVGVPRHRDPRYLREFVAWAEGQYPLGTPGHYAVRAVLKGLRSAVYRAKREGRCLLCGGTR